MAGNPHILGSAGGPSAEAPVPVQVVFPADTYRVLQQLSRQTGRSMQQVLADAIERERWYFNETSQGGRVLVERGPLVFSVSSSSGQSSK